jgi:hypothetical protein
MGSCVRGNDEQNEERAGAVRGGMGVAAPAAGIAGGAARLALRYQPQTP